MNYDRFISEWLRRAERGQVWVDDADRFISLWIAFNAWLKDEYGEDMSDTKLIKRATGNEVLRRSFEYLRDQDNDFADNLKTLSTYQIMDMRFPNDEAKCKSYDRSYDSLIPAIYQIRCNLFHGRKNFEENLIDKQLVTLALKLVLPLLKKSVEGFD